MAMPIHLPSLRGLLPILAVLALALAGCFRESDDNTNEGADAPGEQTAVEVLLTDTAIEMPDEVPGGVVVFEVTNGGEAPHGFVIDGVDGGFDELRADQLDTFQAELEPGTYTVYSPVEGDREAGLELELTVVEGEDDGEAPLNDEGVGPSEEQQPADDEGGEG
jgi:hypothetical protein